MPVKHPNFYILLLFAADPDIIFGRRKKMFRRSHQLISTGFALVAAWPATIYNYQKQISAVKKGKKTRCRNN